MLIFAYADWCGYCKQFMPIWQEFKDKYMPVIDLREINDKLDEKTIKTLGINGYPTIIYLNGSKKLVYEGERTMEGLENFVRQNINPHIKDNLRDYQPARRQP
jgi:thiol-disulfide isomerase/thioredoxin